MANQTSIAINLQLIGDGSSPTATIVLNSTPFYTSDINIQNFSPTPDSVSLVKITDPLGHSVPATATLSKNGKQVLITFSNVFSGLIAVTLNLGYNV